jgi:predicted nucleic acid-binding protein
MLDFENDQNPFIVKKSSIADWRSLAVSDIDETEEIIALSENLEAQGIKPNDALHIACARIGGCDYFITTDRKLLSKNVVGINIVSPIRFVEEVD